MLSDIKSYYSVDSALTKLLQNIKIDLKTEFVPVFSSTGRVLSEDINSNYDIPGFHSSHMDGYAINSKDTANASRSNPVALKLAKDVSVLGKKTNYELKPGEAFRIHTGGFLPFQSDAVIPIEQTVQIDENNINIFSPIKRDSFVYKAGEDIKKGQKILSKGYIIRAQDTALLANVQIIDIPVYKKPHIAIIPTGTELTDNFNEYGKNAFKKINTNGPFIAFIAKEMGAIPNNFPITEDNLDLLKERLKVAIEKSDIVITIGGSSIGKYDLVAESINYIGKPGIIAHGIRLDRGRVTGLGIVDAKPIIMLPGPIQGALNAFIAFVRPIIRSFMGLPQKSNMSFYATIAEDWFARNKFIGFKKIVYVKVTHGVDSLVATPYIGETQSVSLLNKSNGYIEVSEDTYEIKSGQKVLVNLLPGFSFMKDSMF